MGRIDYQGLDNTQAKGNAYYQQYAPILHTAGYEPIPIIPKTKRPPERDWSRRKVDAEQVDRWMKQYPEYGVGLRTGSSGFCPIDVDIYHQGVAKQIAEYLDKILGDGASLPRRFGQAPKFLVPAFCDDIASKLMSDAYVDENGVESKIEILSQGQQVVVHGIHESTGKEYVWVHGSLADSLPKFTRKDALALFEEFYRLARDAGMIPAKIQQEYTKSKYAKNDRIGDQYNDDTDITELITRYGWVLTGRQSSLPDGTPVEHVRRPGKNDGVSGTILGGTHLHVFSTSVTELPSGTYDAFGVYARYEHAGDFRQAIKSLADKGYTSETAKEDFSKFADSDPEAQDYQDEPWQHPVGLEREAPPVMSIGDLPPVLGNMVEGVAKATETPVELAALLGIATLATACQKRFRIGLEPGYSEPLNLYTLTFLEPGNRKSSVQQYLSQPLKEYEKELYLEMEPKIKEAESKKRNQEARVVSLRGLFAKAKTFDDREKLESEILKEEQNPVEVPRRKQIWTQDVTPERLGIIMAENNESTAILSAEGGFFENIGGRYSGNTPNLDLVLQSHSGDSARVDRAGREPVYLENPALTMGLTAQPGILGQLERHKSFRSLGLWARLLYTIPPSPLGYRTLKTVPLSSTVRDEFHSCVKTLLSVQIPSDEQGNEAPFIIPLSPEAHSLWMSFALGVEGQLRDGGEFEHVRDWAGKLPGQAARIAGIFHCADNARRRPWEIPVSKDTMQQALNIAATLSLHALTVFDLMGASLEVKAATKIWTWIERNRLKCFPQRDCHQALRGSFPKIADLRPGIEMLVDRYYIRELPRDSSVKGRPPMIYEVNPLITGEWK